MDRWRKPAGIKAVEHDEENYVLLNEGRRARDMRVVVDEETFTRMRLGYMCAKCYEPQSEPFPEVCGMPDCGFPIRDENLAKLEADYVGEQWLGPRESLEDELMGLEDRRAAKSKIVLPPGVRGS